MAVPIRNREGRVVGPLGIGMHRQHGVLRLRDCPTARAGVPSPRVAFPSARSHEAKTSVGLRSLFALPVEFMV